jgi:hypothetical protein
VLVTALFRHHYSPGELDDVLTEEYVPTYANPGGVVDHKEFPNGHPGWASKRCRTHDVSWATGDCWVCA